jgi:hypothetical protein
MSGRGRLRLSPAWSGGARPVGLADAVRLTATVPPRAGGTATSDRQCSRAADPGMPLRRPGTTAALRRDRHLAEALDRSEDAWSGAGSEQPAPVDPDAAPADLLDDRVQQLVGEQLLEVGAGVKPTRQPAPRCRTVHQVDHWCQDLRGSRSRAVARAWHGGSGTGGRRGPRLTRPVAQDRDKLAGLPPLCQTKRTTTACRTRPPMGGVMVPPT